MNGRNSAKMAGFCLAIVLGLCAGAAWTAAAQTNGPGAAQGERPGLTNLPPAGVVAPAPTGATNQAAPPAAAPAPATNQPALPAATATNLPPPAAPAPAPAGGKPSETPPPGAEKPKDDKQAAYEDIELMTQVIMHIRQHYVTEKSYQEITYGALHGMLKALDPHSDFLEPEDYTNIQEDTAGKFSGIGVHIGVRNNMLAVIAPIEDTPGFRAGLQSGDLILKIDGGDTIGMTLKQAVDKLRGPKGSKVTITIRRAGDENTKDLAIVRDDIEVPSVKGAKIIKSGIGYVRITQFAAPTADALQRALDDLKSKGMKALVLDLRSNPGGLLQSAIEIAQKFLKKGEVIVTTKGRPGVHDVSENKAGGDVHRVDFPMAVLVNGGSASASEIVAGALQDHGRALLVGEKTYGKGSVQSVIRMQPDGKSAIRLTTAYYYTPSGRMIHEKGIEPDILAEISPMEWQKVRLQRAIEESPGIYTEEEKQKLPTAPDRQLERAVDMLQGVLVFAAGKQ